MPGTRAATVRISSSLVATAAPSTAMIRSYTRRPARSPGDPAVTSCTSAPCAVDETERALQVGIDVAQGHADEAARHAPALLQLRQDGHCLVDRHRKPDVAGARADGGVDADDLAAAVDERAAAVAEVDGRVGLDVVVEAVVEQLPADVADDADGDRVLVGERIANRAHPLADAQRIGIAERRERERPRRVDLDQRDVDDRDRCRRAARAACGRPTASP